jgi:hypothetical protein
MGFNFTIQGRSVFGDRKIIYGTYDNIGDAILYLQQTIDSRKSNRGKR